VPQLLRHFCNGVNWLNRDALTREPKSVFLGFETNKGWCAPIPQPVSKEDALVLLPNIGDFGPNRSLAYEHDWVTTPNASF